MSLQSQTGAAVRRAGAAAKLASPARPGLQAPGRCGYTGAPQQHPAICCMAAPVKLVLEQQGLQGMGCTVGLMRQAGVRTQHVDEAAQRYLPRMPGSCGPFPPAAPPSQVHSIQRC